MLRQAVHKPSRRGPGVSCGESAYQVPGLAAFGNAAMFVDDALSVYPHAEDAGRRNIDSRRTGRQIRNMMLFAAADGCGVEQQYVCVSAGL